MVNQEKKRKMLITFLLHNFSTLDLRNIITKPYLTILGDLHMIKGDFEDHTNSDKYVIHGQTIIEANARFGANTNWHTGDITHHGLVTINGGSYFRSNAGGTVKMGGIRNIGGSVL